MNRRDGRTSARQQKEQRAKIGEVKQQTKRASAPKFRGGKANFDNREINRDALFARHGLVFASCRGVLKTLVPNQLWCTEEAMPLLGLQLGARLTIARLHDDKLWVHAPFAIGDADEAAIREQGDVAHIVAPNNFHFKEIGDFTRRFPDAQLWLVPALATKMDELPHLPLHSLPPDWSADFDGVLFDAALGYQEWLFCHRATKSLILTDLITNVPRPDNPLGRITSAISDEGRGAKPSRLIRAAIKGGRDLKKARALINQILDWDFERVVMAHGTIISRNGKRILRRAMRWI